jgi:hypothetical protein
VDNLSETLLDLLFVVERLLINANLSSSTLLKSLSSFADSLPIHSTLKHRCIVLQCKLLKLSKYGALLGYGIEHSYVKEWMQKAPKLLWELQSSNLVLTEV